MEIRCIDDDGCRHEWTCEHDGMQYIISHHFVNKSWSVQLLRGDGEREILTAQEAANIMGAFLKMVRSN